VFEIPDDGDVTVQTYSRDRIFTVLCI